MSMAWPGLTHCTNCRKALEDNELYVCDDCRKKSEEAYKIKTMEVGGDLYEDVEVSSRQELVNAIEQGRVITIRENGKKIYLNARYIVSFEEG